MATMTMKGVPNPFTPAPEVSRRLKLMVWGDSGSGKTTLALQFPSPCVIDLEGGTELYGKDFKFDVLPTSTIDDVFNAVKWLATNEHKYRTIIIDPMTVFEESLRAKWQAIFLRKKSGSRGDLEDNYELQPKDFVIIKSEEKKLLRLLVALDMNVIITCRAKPLYAPGEMMKQIGETFDGDKMLPYLMDTVVRLRRDGTTFTGEAMKDRTNKLPRGKFPCSYKELEKFFGAESLGRAARPMSEMEAKAAETKDDDEPQGPARDAVLKRVIAAETAVFGSAGDEIFEWRRKMYDADPEAIGNFPDDVLVKYLDTLTALYKGKQSTIRGIEHDEKVHYPVKKAVDSARTKYVGTTNLDAASPVKLAEYQHHLNTRGEDKGEES